MICFIKLSAYEYSTIDYLKTVIENKEEEYKMKNKNIYSKLFIFLVHIERIFKKELENPNINKRKLLKKKMLKGTLSNLAGYFQIFIDDINGKDYLDNNGEVITLDKINNLDIKDLIKIFLDLDTIILDNLYKKLLFFDYKFNPPLDTLSKDKYINDLIELFSTDNILVSQINELIINNINSDNSNKEKENIFKKIISEEEFINGDICIFDIITKHLAERFLKEFQILYPELEKKLFFSSILNRKNNYLDNNIEIIYQNNFNEKINQILLSNIDLKKNMPEKEVRLDLFIGFNLPFYNLLININDYIRSKIIEQYRIFEEEFKNLNLEEDEEQIEKEKYKNNISLLNNLTYEKLHKNEIIKNIKNLDFGIKEQFFTLLFEDYLLFYININYKEETKYNKNELKIFLKKIITKKFENNKIVNIKDFCSKVNWLESYSTEIIPLLNTFGFLRESIQNLHDELNNGIKTIKLNSENASFNWKIVNEVFYLYNETLIKILVSNLDILMSKIKKQEEFNQLIDELNNIYFSIIINNNNLNLKSKEIYSLHEAINIISLLSFNKPEIEVEKDKQFMSSFIHKKIIKEKKESSNKEKKGPKFKDNKIGDIEDIEDTQEEKQLKDNLTNFYKYYQRQKKNFNILFSSVLFDEFNKEYNEKYRKYIIQTIINDNNLINYNHLLIKKIIGEILFSELEDMERAFDIISNEDIFFSLFNDSKNENMEKIIMKIFDSIINICFDSVDNFEELIVSDLFEYFKKYALLLNDNKYAKYYNENLCKLFAICYIKIYLKKFSYYLYEKNNFLKGKENNIIQEINKDYKIYNTIQVYLIILLYNETKSIDKLNEFISKENSLEPLFYFMQRFKNEIGEDSFNKIVINSSYLKEALLDKIKYPLSEYFIFTEYPNFNNFKEKFLTINNHNDIFPLIDQFIKNESGPIKLKYLKKYNDFVNLMINLYSGKISRNNAENKIVLNKEEIFKDEIFQKRFESFKDLWNNYLFKDCRQKDRHARQFSGYENIAYFLNDNNENGSGIFISNGFKKFIIWQNKFLQPIINSYKNKKNHILSCYISKIEKKINIQSANELQILQIEKCFENSNYKNFYDLINIYSNRDSTDNNNFIYDYQKIEEELGNLILPGKCLFNDNINYIIYQFEGFKLINYDFLINYKKKFGQLELNIDEKKKILNYTNKEYMNFNFIYDSFIILVHYLNNNYAGEKNKKIINIIEFINKSKNNRHINFSEQFINYFKEEGKEITLDKLLNSIIFMEDLSFNKLKDNIDQKFCQPLEKEDEIKDFFNNNKDDIISKNEIASAIRRYITRFLIIDNLKDNIDETSSLFINLERKYLWNNKIFDKIDENKFKAIIKKYGDYFSFLQVKHCVNFYELIGKEEKEDLYKFIKENEIKIEEKQTMNNPNNHINRRNRRNIKEGRIKTE